MILTVQVVQHFRDRGLTVVEMPGWQNRGETDGPFAIHAIILHHDGEGLETDNVPRYMSQNGVNGAQLWIEYNGTVYVLAAGRKWHAGLGNGWGIIPPDDGNSVAIGVETDHTFGQQWQPALLTAIDVVLDVICDDYAIDPMNAVCGHKEYAPGRKPDPENYDCNALRQRLADRHNQPQEEFTVAQFDQIMTAIQAVSDKVDKVAANAADTQLRVRGTDSNNPQPPFVNHDILQHIASLVDPNWGKA